MQRARRDEVGVGHHALSGLGFLMGVVVPGRCPGLSHYAPLGRKTNAALKAIKLRDRNHRLATRGYGWS